METGLWCDTCLLPSAVRAEVYALTADGVQLVGDITMCPDCDQPRSEDGGR